jgi:hypothetical protein
VIKRPLPILLIFFVCGIVLGYFREIPVSWILGFLAACIALAFPFFLFPTGLHAAAFFLIGCCFFALGTYGISTILYDEPSPDHVFHWSEKGKIVLDGVVCENPRVSEDRTSLVL